MDQAASRRAASLLAWARQNGAYVSPRLTMFTDQGGAGAGVVAAAEIAQAELLIAVPLETLAVQGDTALLCHGAGAVVQTQSSESPLVSFVTVSEKGAGGYCAATARLEHLPHNSGNGNGAPPSVGGSPPVADQGGNELQPAGPTTQLARRPSRNASAASGRYSSSSSSSSHSNADSSSSSSRRPAASAVAIAPAASKKDPKFGFGALPAFLPQPAENLVGTPSIVSSTPPVWPPAYSARTRDAEAALAKDAASFNTQRGNNSQGVPPTSSERLTTFLAEHQPPLAPWLRLALVTMHELGLGASSWYHAYFATLPSEFTTPSYWNDEQWELARGTTVHHLYRRNMIEQQYEDYVRPLFAECASNPKLGALLDPAIHTLEVFRRASSIISSRAFNLQLNERGLPQTLPRPVLVPLADLLNHSTRDVNVVVDLVIGGPPVELASTTTTTTTSSTDADTTVAPPLGADAATATTTAAATTAAAGDAASAPFNPRASTYLALRALRPIAAGQEVLNNYGSLDNGDLVQRYGFVERHAAHRRVFIELSLVMTVGERLHLRCGSRRYLFDDKKKLLKHNNCLEDAYDLCDPGHGRKLLSAVLTVCLMNDRTFTALVNNVGYDAGQESILVLGRSRFPSNPPQVMAAMAFLCEAKLQSYTSSLVEDLEALEQPALDPVTRVVRQLCAEEKRVVAKLGVAIRRHIVDMLAKPCGEGSYGFASDDPTNGDSDESERLASRAHQRKVQYHHVRKLQAARRERRSTRQQIKSKHHPHAPDGQQVAVNGHGQEDDEDEDDDDDEDDDETNMTAISDVDPAAAHPRRASQAGYQSSGAKLARSPNSLTRQPSTLERAHSSSSSGVPAGPSSGSEAPFSDDAQRRLDKWLSDSEGSEYRYDDDGAASATDDDDDDDDESDYDEDDEYDFYEDDEDDDVVEVSSVVAPITIASDDSDPNPSAPIAATPAIKRQASEPAQALVTKRARTS
ncbi:hypothetical protein CAOG_04094 [Capsaspora owczarzaki ATCC 30864]|uniref:SET domain-containing protein n=1 Tax=Capsaspora owczarzaki (strain ATCC 30864) TaxID=595528 RepID=A0A0D2UDX1_CAPO3|nr:hypothetical protein CAOG_04094 [Capsaspora owczarzaki ATCC 30864]KJE93286.1 hypothetical protein CAOG_004094 [Capsaspora owczarzaki ATCC 30864]|eukprot:XP_004347919.1 hypothetical protein CAOG_04094 [Capsaspora owczarzaki ATCC 30864]